MNQSHQALLEELKQEIDGEFGESAVWIHAEGYSDNVFGTFSAIDKQLNIKGHSKKVGQLSVDSVCATFSMAPKAVKGKEGDRLVINGQSYLILPFKPGAFETVIPLKITKNKNHNWRQNES